ncbi:MAG: hypothetical protein ACKPIF_24010, partial [Microcystis panniformis]
MRQLSHFPTSPHPAPPMSGGLGGHTLPPGKAFCRKPNDQSESGQSSRTASSAKPMAAIAFN